MGLEINNTSIKSKTYCEKWPVGCQFCDLLLCDGKKDKYEITTMDKSGTPTEVLTFEYVHPFYSKDGFACSCNKNECDECNKKYVAPSNADRIRAMTDEEMAEMLCSGTCKYCHSYNKDCEILEWLRKDADLD